MVKLSELGEDRLVATLTRDLPGGPRVIAGAGDDCAILGGPRDRLWTLLKTDAVVEGVHFESGEKMARVGWKALARNVSDIAAMGGWPCEALITLAASPGLELRQLTELYRGLTRAARRYGIAIVGGETSRSPGPLFVSVALTGQVERTRCLRRSGGRHGDELWVTGRLGGSRAGRHLDFHPRLAEARWLAEHFRPHAMMDLSDGLGADLPRLARASGCGFALEEAALPRTRGCTAAQALSDGEDFELLFALPARRRAALQVAWRAAFPRLPLTPIGRLTPAGETRTHGFDHFA